MEYKKYKLGDICKIFGRIGFRGYTTEDLVSSPSNGAISLSPSNIVDGIMDLSKCTYISWEKYEESPEIKIAPNDIVLVKTGNSYGRTAIIRNVEHPMTLNPQFVVLKDIQINPVYLAYFLKTDEFQKQIYGIVGGSAIPTLSQENLANLIIRVPNDNIPNTIADILDSLDGKIELNKQINDNLEAMAKQLYDYWFVQFDFPNEEGKPYKSSGGALVYNEKLKREIPQGWHCYELNKWLEIKAGFAFKSETYISKGKFKVVTIKNVQDHHLDTSSCDYVYEIPQGMKEWCSLSVNDRLISLTGNCGRLCIVTENDLLLNQRVGLLACNDEYIDYAYLLLSSEEYQTLSNNLAKGAAQANLSPVDLCKNIAVLPKLDVLEKFNRQIKPIVASYIQNEIQIAELTKQRDELLPLLMNGQASVNYHLSDD